MTDDECRSTGIEYESLSLPDYVSPRKYCEGIDSEYKDVFEGPISFSDNIEHHLYKVNGANACPKCDFFYLATEVSRLRPRGQPILLIGL